MKVNLASYLLLDGFRNDFEAAVVISDDADLIVPIRMVRTEIGLTVGILNPQVHYDAKGRLIPRYELKQAATRGFYRDIDRSLLPQCHLPDPITLLDGTELRKPVTW